ncbi:MAG: hypothetical protein J5I65_08680 [Aridibacter famidurans]|nr:hypothetical protein [Aridibacter famidurans]
MNRAPKWFVPVAVVALIWNLLGCVAYLFDVMMSPEEIAKLSAAEQALYASRPAWSVAATAVAVWFGALGCVGLVLKKRWSLPVLALSLAGVIVQDFSLFVLGGAGGLAGPAVYAVQGIVLVVSIGLVFMSLQGVKKGWLS